MKIIGVQEFIRRFKHRIKYDNAKFCIFLGAGCSVSSGIPTAGTLVSKEWLPKLKEIETGNQENFDEWLEKRFPKYDKNNPAQSYGEIIENLFPTRKERQTEIERLVKGWYPAFGYAVLAKLIEKIGTQCNIILTTNFDDMVADALYLYTDQKPLVIFHEALATFVKISDIRPIVIKLHGDSKLYPLNTKDETKELNEKTKKVLINLFSETGLIFIGYGGSDSSIIEILNEISEDEDSFPWGIYWVGENISNEKMREFLESRNALWVKHRNFDQLMLLLKEELELELPTKDKFDMLFNDLSNTFSNLTQDIHAQPNSEEKDLLEKAARKASKELMFSINAEIPESMVLSIANSLSGLSVPESTLSSIAKSLSAFNPESTLSSIANSLSGLSVPESTLSSIAKSLSAFNTPKSTLSSMAKNFQPPSIDTKALQHIKSIEESRE